MNSIAKRCRIGDNATKDDLISNLPIHIIRRILDCMLINDAARTSVLSKTWKNIWRSRMYLILTQPFFYELVSNKDVKTHESLFPEAVTTILLAHEGRLKDFHLYVPPNINIQPYHNFWMRLLSTKEVERLALNNANPDNFVSSNLFSCSKLVCLELSKWRINPPPKFEGFRNLNIVILRHVTLHADMSFGPQVNILHLESCLGIQHLGSQFTHHNKNIKILFLFRDEEREKLYALDHGKDPMSSTKECINLHRFLSSAPKLAGLLLNGSSLRFLDPDQAILTKLATVMENMVSLKLWYVDFNDLRQIANILCLIRSSPNLQTLWIEVGPEVKSTNPVELTAENYLETIDCMNINMDQIRTVEILNAVGSRAELLFIKILLASFPSRRRMSFSLNNTINYPIDGLTIALELLQFRRRSSIELVWDYYKQ